MEENLIRWDPSIGLAGIITALSFVAAAIGLWFTGHQIRQSTKMRRGQFLLDATERYFSDTEVRKLYYDIDYGEFSIEFNAAGEPSTFTRHQSAPQRFIGSAEERHLDSLLYTLDCIGRIVEIGVFDRREAQLFAFQANRVFHNSHVAEILRWLDKERERFGGEVPTHSAGRALAGQAPARSA
jgi:hypothetical protein